MSALWELYCGRDVLLVVKTKYDKTLVITGYHTFLQPGKSVTLILSLLKATEYSQDWEFTEQFDNLFKPFVLNGESNIFFNYNVIAQRNYIYV